MTILETADDLTWLRDVHGVDTTGVVLAILHGNEDSPHHVELYTANHVDCVPRVVTFDGQAG